MKDTSFYVTEPTRQARIAEPLPDDRSIGVNADVVRPARGAQPWNPAAAAW